MSLIARPSIASLKPGFASYVEAVPDGDLLAFLESQRDRLSALFSSLDEAKGGHRYAPGKWSLKEVLGHVSDTERILAYRLLCIARGEKQSLPGFEENDYVEAAAFDRRSLANLLAEFLDIRRASLSLIRSLEPEVFDRTGIANQNPLTVATIAYVLAGHAEHHLSVVKERYLRES